ncbi:MAG: RHS repeat-associated core domain-containing protein, partial [Planctomycetales bacterium]
MPNESHFRLWTASDDENRTTQFTYTADGALATLKALNATTGDQTTTYTYGTTLSNSAVATSVLLRQVQYPDSAGGSDVELFEYNRQTQPTKFTDQLGTVHQYDYDLLGRQTQDRVTTLGTNVDGAVRRIQTTYVVRGMLQKVTSYDNAAVGSGSIVNEVQRAYNHFRQLEFEYQSHSGAVNTGTSPKVTYGYADAGSGSNTNRPTSMTYPSGWKLNYD